LLAGGGGHAHTVKVVENPYLHFIRVWLPAGSKLGPKRVAGGLSQTDVADNGGEQGDRQGQAHHLTKPPLGHGRNAIAGVAFGIAPRLAKTSPTRPEMFTSLNAPS
jgi:hypothetical protein